MTTTTITESDILEGLREGLRFNAALGHYAGHRHAG